MSPSYLFLLQLVLLILSMCLFYNGFSQDVAVAPAVHSKPVVVCSNCSTTLPKPRHKLCACRKYRCSCCLNLSFIRQWKALGCFNIQSLPGNLNIILSFSFNQRHIAVFPISVNRPMSFCKQLHMSLAEACLVIYNVRTDTPHDITVCLYLELRVRARPVATVHLDCIRKIHRHIHFIPVSSHTRKGCLLDVHVLPNDTTLTILRQEFHWTRSLDDDSFSSESESESKSESDLNVKRDSSESESGLNSASDSAYEDIRPEPRKGVVRWLKKLFGWWQDYHQDFK